MKFELDFRIQVGDQVVDGRAVEADLDTYRDQLKELGSVNGILVLRVDGEELLSDTFDPILRLADLWVRKVPWIIAGDTETVALRNSAHCYAFVPAGESVELSFFSGSETEIEEYVIEPITVRLDAFVTQSLAVANRLLELAKRIDPALLESSEDCQALAQNLPDAQQAWRDYTKRR